MDKVEGMRYNKCLKCGAYLAKDGAWIFLGMYGPQKIHFGRFKCTNCGNIITITAREKVRKNDKVRV